MALSKDYPKAIYQLRKDMSARARCKFKRKSKLVSEVRRQEYEDTTMNKGVRVKKYRRTRKKGSKMKVQSPKYK